MRRALLIATDTYRDPTFGALRAPRLDAAELDAVLSDPAIGDFTTEVLVNEPVQHLRERIETVLGEAGHDDLVLLYLSGHGVKARLGDLHFVTTDTRHTVLATTSLDAAFVRRQIDDSLAGQVVVWLDCCYGGAFPSGMLPRATEDVDVVQQLAEGRGCAVMTASTHIQYAYEPVGDHVDDRAEPSVFTKAIIDGLRTGDADLDHDGEISARDLYGYVHDRVRRTNPDQTPTSSGTLSGDLRIAYAGTPLPPGLPDELRRLLRSPEDGFRRAGLRILHERAHSGDQVSLAVLHALRGSADQLLSASAQEALTPRTTPRPDPPAAPHPNSGTTIEDETGQAIRTILRRSVPEFSAQGVVGHGLRVTPLLGVPRVQPRRPLGSWPSTTASSSCSGRRTGSRWPPFASPDPSTRSASTTTARCWQSPRGASRRSSRRSVTAGSPSTSPCSARSATPGSAPTPRAWWSRRTTGASSCGTRLPGRGSAPRTSSAYRSRRFGSGRSWPPRRGRPSWCGAPTPGRWSTPRSSSRASTARLLSDRSSTC
ncbi:caspase family protein [Saccharothrix sp. NRRL B-16348]|uniref:caspase family protein n=1 Tax=Saccharothrix sp. NRRL B-16348 TaxID=1415542 RepID=UPI000AD489B9|nr:caspase family protein [Saccharothrix sp. NRRL B-16348]